MKAIIELTRSISEPVFYAKQFSGILPSYNTDVTNILFLNPQLSGKHLYKMFIPYFMLAGNPKIKTAIQHISKFSNEAQIIGGKETELTADQITWANIIVFPFTSQPLVSEIYARIRNTNPFAKIIYQIDFNFYEMSPKHPFYDVFTDEIILNEVENNAYFADVIMVANMEFAKYLYDKFSEMVIAGKYKGVPSNVKIACQPLLVNDKLMLENIDYTPEVLLRVTAKEFTIVPATENPPALADKLNEISQTNKTLTERHEAENIMKQEKVKAQREKEQSGKAKKITVKKPSVKKAGKVSEKFVIIKGNQNDEPATK